MRRREFIAGLGSLAVDKQLLAGDVNLAQAQLEAPGPFLVALAEPRVAEAVGGRIAWK